MNSTNLQTAQSDSKPATLDLPQPGTHTTSPRKSVETMSSPAPSVQTNGFASQASAVKPKKRPAPLNLSAQSLTNDSTALKSSKPSLETPKSQPFNTKKDLAETGQPPMGPGRLAAARLTEDLAALRRGAIDRSTQIEKRLMAFGPGRPY